MTARHTPPRRKPKIRPKYIVAAIGAAGVVLAAVIAGVFSSSPTPSPIRNQAPSPTISTSPLSPTTTATATPSCSDNLIACSNATGVTVDGQSTSTVTTVGSNHLQVSFNNFQKGSGVALQLAQDLNVSGFHFAEIEATSTQEFSFLLEYKVDKQETPSAESGHRTFPKAPISYTERVPLVFTGTVGVLVLNFFKPGESSNVVINAIRLI